MKPEYLEPWVAVGKFADNLTAELNREVTERHVLWRQKTRPLAQRVDCDDVLFEIEGAANRCAVVHLTWSGKTENDPHYPDTELFATLDDWVRDRMMVDHLEYIGGDQQQSE